MLHLLTLAGDFAGVPSTGMHFVAHGIPIQILIAKAHHFIEENAEVLITDTETRHLSPKETGKTVRALTGSTIHAGVSCVYKKTDSALCGSVGVKLEAALSGSGESVFPFLPASPELRRTIAGGRQYIGGMPANESPFGKDPFEPMRMAGVTTLFGLQSSLSAKSFPPLEMSGTVSSRRDTLVFDAGSEEESLASGGALLWNTVPRVLASCAGFAAYSSELPGFGTCGDSNLSGLSPRLLVLCRGVNPATRHQLSVAADEGFGHVRLTPQGKASSDSFATTVGDVTLQALREQLREHPHFITDNNDAGDNMETKNHAGSLGLPPDKLRFRIADTLGIMLAEFAEEPVPDILLLTGDDALLQCMNTLGVWKVESVGKLESRIVLYHFPYHGEEHAVATESGGFGGEDPLSRLVHFLERKIGGEKR